MEQYYLQITDLVFGICTEWPITVQKDYRPFLCGPHPVRQQIELKLVDHLPELPEPDHWFRDAGRTEFRGKQVILHRTSEHAAPSMMELSEDRGCRTLFYQKDSGLKPHSMMGVFKEIGLENVLLQVGALILHSAFIRWQGKGILFSAPSGTGKSTQADLWAKYMGADILNGDRSGLRKKDGTWRAYGLPFAGSSDIYRNESAPIEAIVMLSQSSGNRIERLNPAAAFRRIYPEVTLHRWDDCFLHRGLDLTLDLLQCVPVYHLSCRPDRGAVELLHETLTQEV